MDTDRDEVAPAPPRRRRKAADVTVESTGLKALESEPEGDERVSGFFKGEPVARRLWN